MKKQFVVIGLGGFGKSVCKQLYHLGHEVLAIDNNHDNVAAVTDYSSHAAVADATDEEELKSLGISNFEYAIVAIGEEIQPSILCTMILKEVGVNKVWVKAQNIQHQKLLEKIGADRVIHPEQEMAIRIANQLDSDKIIDYLELSKDYSIIELEATEKIANRSLVQLNVRAKYGVTVLLIRHGEQINVSPLPEDIIKKGDVLVVMGDNKSLKNFEKKAL